MLDEILGVGCSFDWITPSVAFLQDLINGPPADFGIPDGAGWSRRDIRRLLTGNGVHVWGLIFSRELLIFTVPKAQARWTYYLLKREGVPIAYAPNDVLSSPPARPRKRTHAAGTLDPILRLLDTLERELTRLAE